MKNKKKLYSVALASTALVFVLLISLSPAALASDVENNAHKVNKAQMTTRGLNSDLPAIGDRIMSQVSTVQSSLLVINETRVTINESNQSYPAIYGDNIVWADERNGNTDIYSYNLSTSRETQITSNESNQTWPTIHGNRIVWMDDRNGNSDIYMYDLSTSREIQITTNESDQEYPVIYGDRIVYNDGRNGGSINADEQYEGNWDIYVYDLSISKETQITTSEFRQYYPYIYGNRIVWEDDRNGNRDIYMYDLSTSTETRITTNELNQELPFIHGDRIVWMDWRNGNQSDFENADVYMYDISTSKETQITTDESNQIWSTPIHEDRIVWEDDRNGNADIYMYNLSSSTETRITANELNQFSPAIYGDRIVWWDDRNGNWDIYMCTVSEVELKIPVANFTTSDKSGYAPLFVQFTDSSENATSWNWNFGDGATSTEQSPAHTYSKAGTYIVNLTVNNGNGTASKLINIDVLQRPVYAYITNYYSNNVSVIDTATNTVTATIPVGSDPMGVAVTTDGTKVYVANENSSSVSVIDTATNTVTTTVNVGNAPEGVAVTPDGKKVYVANSDDNTTSVIDTSSNTVTATVPVAIYPSGVAVTPDGKKVYVASSAYMENLTYSSTVSVIDTAKNTVTSTVNVGAGSIGVSVVPDGSKVYVANGNDNTVSVIDTTTNKVTATLNVGSFPFGVAVTPDGRKVYVANSDDNTTSVIDTTTNIVTATVRVGTRPLGVAVSPDGTKVYVTNGVDNNVSVIDAATNTVTATVPVGEAPFAFGQFIVPPLFPVADFSANVTSGYAPLSVQFTDLSQHAISRNWSFGDGATSTEKNPMHTYSAAGTYTVSLTAGNANGTFSKNAQTNVMQESSSSSGSSGGSSHSSSGGSSGGGGSPEPARNVEVKEISQAHVANGKPVKFDFAKNATCVVYVTFDAKKTVGKTTTIAEQLKTKSTLVSNLSSGEVYKYFNLWVGNSGFATEKNIGNPVVCFKVEKSWTEDKDIDQASITLNRYSDKKWSQLPVKLLKEDDKYLYFTAETPEFSFFAITGKAGEKEAGVETKPETDTQDPGQNITASETKQETGTGKIPSTPGFEAVYFVACLLTVFLHKRK
ncbi:PGF-pre-PGF domain-containing protein [Methanosarcina sp.]|uniref:PGF-pre-PGF domain-containing protein n=1 Tax=Methanosarcina sp. TaxID=2213 RepID=UPI003C783372